MTTTPTMTRPSPLIPPSPARSLRARWRLFMILGMNVLVLIVVGSAILIAVLEQRSAITRLHESATQQAHLALDQSAADLRQTLVFAGERAAAGDEGALDDLLAAYPALVAVSLDTGTAGASAITFDGGEQITLTVPAGAQTVIAQVDPRVLWAETLSAVIGKKGYLYLVSENGTVLAANIQPERDPKSFAVFKQSRDDGAAMRLYRGLEGKWVIGRAEFYPSSGYTIIVETPLDEYAPLAVRTLVLIALAMIVTALAGEWLSRRILRTVVTPLERLQAGARAVIAGDYHYRVRVPPHTDRELSELGDTFNRMINRLAESQRQINAYTNEMQEIIDLRARELARKANQLEIAFEVSTTIGGMLEPRPLIESIVRLIRERFRLYHVDVLLLDHDSGKITSSDAQRQATLPNLTTRDAANSVIAGVARHGETQYVADVTIERRYARTSDLPASQSELAIPLNFEDQTLGVLNLEADHRDAFAKDDIAVLTGLAKMIAVAVHNAQTVQSLQDANRDLAQATLHANQADYLKSRFLYNVTQRFRAPLSAIIGSAETMTAADLSGPARERQRRILENGRVLQALVEDMIDLSAIETGYMQLDLQWIKLTPLLEEVMNAARALHQAAYADHDLTLKLDLTHLTEPLPPVWADIERLRYILMNLISNAIKFTESGDVVLSANFDAGRIYIHVRDTGPGISDDDRRTLFDPFQHPRAPSEPDVKTTGLGLPVSHLLAMRHGGDLTFDSTLHEGSTFTLNLPRHPDGAPPPPEQ